jgi:hypothetical protein
MKTKMTLKAVLSVALLALLAIGMPAAAAAQTAQTAQPERWLHVRVESTDGKGELVRVNMPLSLAEKLLPAVRNERLRDGKVTINEAKMNGVDLRAVLEAVRTTRDGEFVTVQSNDGEVRVAKKEGYLYVNARENKKDKKTQVEVKVPMTVVDALLSSGTNELDLVAAVRVLSKHGDSELVMVKDNKNTVRVWLDSKNTSE